jgi:hypothetical protein
MANGVLGLHDLEHHAIGHSDLSITTELRVGDRHAFLGDRQAHDVAKERHYLLKLSGRRDDPLDSFGDLHAHPRPSLLE